LIGYRKIKKTWLVTLSRSCWISRNYWICHENAISFVFAVLGEHCIDA